MPNKFERLLWRILGRCAWCGGEVEDWSSKFGICKSCGRKDTETVVPTEYALEELPSRIKGLLTGLTVLLAKGQRKGAIADGKYTLFYEIEEKK